jgi:glycine betaine/proline transport system substrate-binding protein
MRTRGMKTARIAAVGVLAGVLLAGCGGSDIKEQDTAASGGKKCDDFNMAINPWVGYEASAHVVGYVAKSKLGCKVEYKDLKEEVAWQGFGSGEVDTVIENWGHEDLKKKYVSGNKTAQVAGPNGNIGVIGWYVPPWLAKDKPDITNWKNLNKYADLFKTSESGGKGQLLDGDPSFVTNDEALVKNLDLDYKVVYAGSEPALIQAFRTAEKNKKPVIGYFYDPQWFMSEVPLVKVKLPKYTPGCDADPAKVACDYPKYTLDKIVATKFAESGSPAYDLVKAFKWTNDDQNLVAKYIAQDKMDPEDAAKKWVDANPDKVDAWLS